MDLKTRYFSCFLAAVLAVCLALSIGYAAGRDLHVVAGSLTVLELLPLFVICRLLPIEFGSSGLTRNQLKAHLIIFALLSAVAGVPWGFMYQISDQKAVHSKIGLFCTIVCGFCFALLSGRPIYLCAALFGLPHGLRGVGIPPLGPVPRYDIWYGWVVFSWFFCTSFARYKKDQSILGMLTVAVASCMPVGYTLATSPGFDPNSLILVFFGYAQILWIRRGRRLPPGLEGCKFVTLEYIRRAAASGEGIRRCQDLPPDAFGEPGKARFVISMSHRWLDRYTCDIKSEAYPEGMRLQTMLAVLDEYFSVRGIGKGRGFRNRLQRLAMALTGGRDVVLFFDFMCLPQESVGADGTLQKRCPHEQLLFSRCLPNMGSLYSMLPVLVCEDVPKGVLPYLDSGWCFAEVSTAWLGHQLTTYSEHCRATKWFRHITLSNNDDPTLFLEALDHELKHKYFLREEDREDVRNIIRGFHMKNRLVVALKKKASSDLQTILSSPSFKSYGLLDQAVDADLNTPLHIAVAKNFPEGVKLLLDSGARRDLRNLRGDLPVDCFMLPRLSKAAFACRKYSIMQNLEPKLGLVRNISHSSFRSSGKSTTACQDSCAEPGHTVIDVDKDSAPESEGFGGTREGSWQLWPSSVSGWVSNPPASKEEGEDELELEQPNCSTEVAFASWTGQRGLTPITSPLHTSNSPATLAADAAAAAANFPELLPTQAAAPANLNEVEAQASNAAGATGTLPGRDRTTTPPVAAPIAATTTVATGTAKSGPATTTTTTTTTITTTATATATAKPKPFSTETNCGQIFRLLLDSEAISLQEEFLKDSL